MRSPYAAPDTPIASAKRPRPNGSAVRLDYGAASMDSEKENEGVLSPMGKRDSHLSPESPDSEGSGNRWKGHLGALFSPVLRIFGNEGDESTTSIESYERQMQLDLQRQQMEEEHRNQQHQDHGDDDVSEYDEDEEEFNPYLFMKQLPPYLEALGGTRVTPSLPPRRLTRNGNPLTLVLDLDETLVHCSVEATPNADIVFPVHFNEVEYKVHVQKRPHLEHFLQEVSRRFEVVVFTASQQVYADKLLDILDPKREYIKHRLFRDSCLLVEGNYLKDLNVLGRDMDRTILVDNSPHAFGYQVDNGIPIESWFDDPHDKELLKLLKFLDRLHGVDDVRPVVRDHFRTYRLIDQA